VNNFSQDKEARLLELLNQEIELYERIYELTERQTKQLTQDDAGTFNSSLDKRQEFIEKINGLHQETDILMQSYMSFTSSAGGVSIDAIDNAAAKRHELIAGCSELNKKNMAAAKEKAEDYVKRIQKLSLNRKSLETYTPDILNNSVIIDKKT